MTGSVATIIRCSDLMRHVYSTLESIERQTGGRGEIVLVTDESTPIAARDWLVHLAGARDLIVADAPSPRPGAIRNTGVRATKSEYLMCIGAGDLLDSGFHEASRAKLEEHPEVDVVTSWMQVVGPGSSRRIVMPEGYDLDALIGDTEAIHGASMFRRQAWDAIGGFDESLPALEAYDFWVRLLETGRRCALIEHPLLVRVLREDALYRRAWERDQHVAAIERLIEKHRTLFGHDSAHALYVRERLLQKLGDQYRSAITRRDSGVRELESLKARAVELRQALPEGERDRVDFGDLNRTTPVARDWGYERGRPIDRHYVERFLEQHAADIRGAVLEVQEAEYTRRFGGIRVDRSDVIDLIASNPLATLITDLRSAANIQSDTYDCVILTQTLHIVDDMRAVVSECARILKPGGVLLATLPCASRLCLEYGHDGDFWRVTEAGARKLFSEAFRSDALDIQAHGNVRVNAAFLYGLACHELPEADFDAVDPYFPLLVSVRAMKATLAPPPTVPVQGRQARLVDHRAPHKNGAHAAVLRYHRVGHPRSDIHGLCVPLQEFHAQMAHLTERYRPMPLSELVAAAQDGHAPAGAIAVTFDDGYIDNYTEASPILSALGVPATFFVTTDRIGEPYEFWWDALERILLSRASAVPPHLQVDLPDGARTFATRTEGQRLAAHEEIYRGITGSPADVRDRIIDTLRRWNGEDAPVNPLNRRMRPDEIVSLAARPGHTVGAHSVRHLMLPRQPVVVQRDEIEGSRRTLEALLARPVRAFAYPFGAFSQESINEVRAASFDVAVTCEDAPLVPGIDPLRVPRLEVTPRNAGRFAGWLANRLAR